MIGAFLGGVLVWLAYLPHWEVTEDKGAKLGVFCTAPGHPQAACRTCSPKSSAPSCSCSACWRFCRRRTSCPTPASTPGFAPCARRRHRLGHRPVARRTDRLRDQSGARPRPAPRALRPAHRRQGRFRLGLRLDSRRRSDHRRRHRRAVLQGALARVTAPPSRTPTLPIHGHEIHPRPRSGHDQFARHRLRSRRRRRRRRAAGVPRRSSPSPAGSSTTPRKSGPRRRSVAAEALREGAAHGRGHRRHRHHQPARDHRRLGPRDRQARSATPSSGRTAARPPICDKLKKREARARRSAKRPASWSTPISPPPSCSGFCNNVPGAKAKAKAGEARVRHHRLLAASGISPAASATSPMRATPRARCSSTSTPASGTTELLEALRRAALRCCRRCARRAKSTARRKLLGRRHSRSPASRATSRPRSSARPAPAPAW